MRRLVSGSWRREALRVHPVIEVLVSNVLEGQMLGGQVMGGVAVVPLIVAQRGDQWRQIVAAGGADVDAILAEVDARCADDAPQF